MKYVIGVDEAGRGALAGPVCVGAVLVPEDFEWRTLFQLITRKHHQPVLKDSKQLTAQQRNTLFAAIIESVPLRHAHAFVDAKTIDEIGIVNAAHEAAALAIGELGVSPGWVEILLDAGLKAPSKFTQHSFIRGDETIPAIALASIVAKVSRDRLMEELSPRYAAYGLAQHKGYGTLFHRHAIAKSGLSDLHRASFCTRVSGGGLGRKTARALQKAGI